MGEYIIADIHCHSTFRPFTASNKTTINEFWPPLNSEEELNKSKFKDRPLFYQSSFSSILSSKNVRIVVVSLLSLEQGFLLKNNILGITEKLAYYITDINYNRTRIVTNLEHDYFDDLTTEFELLSNSNNWKAPSNVFDGSDNSLLNAEVKVVGDYNELTEYLEENKGVAIILTIEGGHSLGPGSMKWINKINDNDLNALSDSPIDPNDNNINLYSNLETLILNHEEFINPDNNADLVKRFSSEHVRDLMLTILQNINKIKKWGDGKYAPLFITFSHHFWNQLCGHAISLPSPIFNQNQGLERPFTEVGKIVISSLLSNNNGKRILIDTKHMSLSSKKWYYNCVNAYNEGVNNSNLKIPIISSHSAVNGKLLMPEFEENLSIIQNNFNYYNSNSKYNIWNINLSDEEIIIIHKSNGMIGLNFDQRIIAGYKWSSKIQKKYSNKAAIDSLENGEDEWLYEWTAIIAEQIYHVAKTIANYELPNSTPTWSEQNNLKIWQRISIGSDFDGYVNPIDAYCSVIDLSSLKDSLFKRFKDLKNINTINTSSNNRICNDLMFRLTDYPLLNQMNDEQISEIINKFLFDNVKEFLKLYFTNEYRC